MERDDLTSCWCERKEEKKESEATEGTFLATFCLHFRSSRRRDILLPSRVLQQRLNCTLRSHRSSPTSQTETISLT